MFENISVWAVLAVNTIASAIAPSLSAAPADTAPQVVVSASATASAPVSPSSDPIPSESPVSAAADSSVNFYRSPVTSVPAPPKPTPTPTPTPSTDPTPTTDPTQAPAPAATTAPQAPSGSGASVSDNSSSNSAGTQNNSPVPVAAAAVSVTPGSAQAIAADQMKGYGWGPDQLACLVPLWNRESSWSVTANNPSSGAYGIPQSLPGNKMASAGADWQTNPATQIKWGLGYIHDRYGDPCGAWAHSNATGWY